MLYTDRLAEQSEKGFSPHLMQEDEPIDSPADGGVLVRDHNVRRDPAACAGRAAV